MNRSNPDSLYLDPDLRLLDPFNRRLAPAAEDRGLTSAQVRGVDTERRQVRALVSTPNPDRYGEVVLPEAFKKWLPRFMENPVLLAGHAHSGMNGEPTVIGRWVELKITKEGLLGVCEFMRDDALAESWWRRFEQGVVKAFSVGFLVHAWEMREFKTENGSERLRVFTEIELIEISVVSVPANRESLVRMLGGASERSTPERTTDDAHGPRLSNRQLSIATRILAPVVEQVVKAHLAAVMDGVRDVVQIAIESADSESRLDRDYRLALQDPYLRDLYGGATTGDKNNGGDDIAEELREIFAASGGGT